VDVVSERFALPGYVFLDTLELDVDQGRFPEAFASFIADEAWDYSSRFFVADIRKPERAEVYCIGQLTFEHGAGQLGRILQVGDGIRWGAALRVGGVQVRDSDAADSIQGSPFDADHAIRLERLARLGWAANSRLDQLAIAIAGEDDTLLGQLRAFAPPSASTAG
jgi:hypothetical protein